LLLGCLASGFVVFFVYFVILRKSCAYFWPDSYEYAQVARNIARGEGVRTNFSFVLEVWMLYKGTLPLPYFLHDMGNSLLMAAFFKVFGASEAVVAWTSGTFFILLRVIDHSGATRGHAGPVAPTSLSSPAVLGLFVLLAALNKGPVIASTRLADTQASREYRSYAVLIDLRTPPDAVVLTRPSLLMYGLAWYCRGHRVFVQDSDYTRRVLRSQRSRPLFLIATPEDTGGAPTAGPDAEIDKREPPEGFVEVFRRRPTALPAVLYRAEGS
jgi:hypothetical protein